MKSKIVAKEIKDLLIKEISTFKDSFLKSSISSSFNKSTKQILCL